MKRNKGCPVAASTRINSPAFAGAFAAAILSPHELYSMQNRVFVND